MNGKCLISPQLTINCIPKGTDASRGEVAATERTEQTKPCFTDCYDSDAAAKRISHFFLEYTPKRVSLYIRRKAAKKVGGTTT
jgi:hypothetical protein